MTLTNAQAEDYYENLPKGDYGVQLGDYNPVTGQIVWGGAQWNTGATESAAREIANRWRKESIDLVIQREGRRIDKGSLGQPITSEMKALFYRPVRLGD